MSTLYIRLPSRAAVGSMPDRSAMPCHFALVSKENTVERQGAIPLSGLADAISKVHRVVLLLAAVDVTLLQVKVPKLSAAKLKAALPNLVEDQLIADTSECVVVAGGVSEGLRTVAVAKREWLDALDKTLTSLGARYIVALPAQLCLPYQAGSTDHPAAASCSVITLGDTMDVALRLSEHTGIGLAIGAERNEATNEVVQALNSICPEMPITLYVPQAEHSGFQELLNDAGESGKRYRLSADGWPGWVSGASSTTLDLMAGLRSRAAPQVELRAWRWPLVLATAVLLLNIFALNIDWWRMRSEASSLRANMVKTYKSAFPKETVVIDPVAQMRQKIAAAKTSEGGAPDDFIAITSAFGIAWSRATAAPQKATTISSLEYRDRGLLVRLKPVSGQNGTPGANARDIEALTERLTTALAERGLSLERIPSEPAGAWKIRSAK